MWFETQSTTPFWEGDPLLTREHGVFEDNERVQGFGAQMMS